MEKKVTVTDRELLRIDLVSRAARRELCARVVADGLGISVRQVRRLIQAYRMKGAAGLIHGNRGRVSPRRTPDATRQQIIDLLRSDYTDYNTSALHDVLQDEHGVRISYTALRHIRMAAGFPSPRRYRVRAHRRRRERAAQEGLLLQIDGSSHAWLEDRGPRLALIAFIDDATGKITGAIFRDQEDVIGYLQVLSHTCQTYGLPHSLYTDRHTIFQSPKNPTLQQKLRGEKPLSQFGRVLAQLGIQHIAAQSPQAKGRIERLFGTLQDRLVKELRRCHATTRQQANQVLQQYIPKFNARFGKPPRQPDSAYRPWPQGLRPEFVLALRYERTVANDHTISFGGLRLPLMPARHRRNFVKARVQLFLHLDGQLTIHYQDQTLGSFAHDPDHPVRANHFVPAEPIHYLPTVIAPSPPKPRSPTRPGPTHPWRYPYKPVSDTR